MVWSNSLAVAYIHGVIKQFSHQTYFQQHLISYYCCNLHKAAGSQSVSCGLYTASWWPCFCSRHCMIYTVWNLAKCILQFAWIMDDTIKCNLQLWEQKASCTALNLVRSKVVKGWFSCSQIFMHRKTKWQVHCHHEETSHQTAPTIPPTGHFCCRLSLDAIRWQCNVFPHGTRASCTTPPVQ
jgi:hypothetical protein